MVLNKSIIQSYWVDIEIDWDIGFILDTFESN